MNIRNFAPGALLFRIRREWFAFPDEFDRKFGVETRLNVGLRRLRSKSDSVGYEAIHPLLFARALPFVPRHTFVDLGCGKGRALILAHNSGFRDLIGVEISHSLAKAAARNTRKLGIESQIVQSDAAAYQFPDRPIVLFMYNPFGIPTMQAVIRNLARNRHPVHVIYVNPRHQSLFLGCQLLYADHTLAVLCSSADQVRGTDLVQPSSGQSPRQP